MSDEPRTSGPAEQTSPPADPTEIIDVSDAGDHGSLTPAQDDCFDVPVPDQPSNRTPDGRVGDGDRPIPTRADQATTQNVSDTLRFSPVGSTQPLVRPEPLDPAEGAPATADGAPGTAPGRAAYHGVNQTVPLSQALLPPPPPPSRRRSRGPLVALVLALCLASGAIGGVVGQLVADRPTAGSTMPQPGPGATARPEGSVASIAAKAVPSVVTIQVKGGQGEATGSGFVIDDKGHILTNNHVVASAGDNGAIQVVLSNGDTEPATIVGRDGSYDLAVIKVSRTDLTPLVLGPSDRVVVGDEVIAVGAPLGLDQTVTSGIVSALNRPVTPGAGDEASFINAIQTDAAINPGNSGGPLLDMQGQVIGINSAIARVPGSTGSSGGNIGLGFAIPSDQARRTADQLIATGHATHPVIGVLLDRTFSGEGAQVSKAQDAVTSDGPADKAGIKPGDVIVGFEGKRIRTPDQLIVSIRARAVGDTVSLEVKRGSEELDLKMTLEAAPSD